MTDHKTIQLVVTLLGSATLGLIGILGLLAFQNKELPEALTTLAGSGLGALGTLLVSTRGSSDHGAGTVTADVSVVAPADREAGHSEVDTVLLVLVAVGVLLLLAGFTFR